MPEVVVEVETNRLHVQEHQCQLRFRVTNPANAAWEVTLRAELLGRGTELKQDDDQLEQFCRLQKRGDQLVLSFPFRPTMAGEFALESLRLLVGPAGRPAETRAYELPDRSLYVNVADPERPSPGPGIVVGGDIHLDFSQLKEMYASDIDLRDLLKLPVEPPAASGRPPPQWEAILLNPAGVEARVACGLERCGRPIRPASAFRCADCGRLVCGRHRDPDQRQRCQVCGEEARAKEFDAASRLLSPRIPGGPATLFDQLTSPHPGFLGRIWTARDTRPTTRDLSTVARHSRDCQRIGGEFTLHVQAERDCRLTLLDFGTSGSVYLLLANYPLPAGPPLALSGPNGDLMWCVSPPQGIERIKALFHCRPLPLFPGIAPGTRLSDPALSLQTAWDVLKRIAPNEWSDAACEFAIL
jgi:hypothetical protein